MTPDAGIAIAAAPAPIIVCVPTHRRPAQLARLLRAIREQRDAPSFEILVGNNDDAELAAHAELDDPALPRFRVIRVAQRGVSAVRNALVADVLANRPYARWIACLDDDQIPSAVWLATLAATGVRYDADLVGGPVTHSVAATTFWSRGAADTSYLPIVEGPVQTLNEAGNLLLSTRFVRALGRAPFSLEFGTTGGEDYEFFLHAQMCGARIYWAPGARVDEPLPPNRLTLRGYASRFYAIAAYQARADRCYHGSAYVLRTIARDAVKGIAMIGSALLRGDAQRAVAAMVQYASSFVGRTIGFFGIRADRYGQDPRGREMTTTSISNSTRPHIEHTRFVEAPAVDASPAGGMRSLATFWHGPPLSRLDLACLRSFVAAGFDVTVYGYDRLDALPADVVFRDAAEIVDRRFLWSFVVNGKPSLSHFSDLFRYRLFLATGEAWVDMDLFCLAPFEVRANENFIAREDASTISSSILGIDRAHPRLPALVEQAESFATGRDFKWGSTGPALLTRVLGPEVVTQARDESLFFPVPWDEWWKPFVPSARDECEVRCADALGLHLWNNIVERSGFWKDLAPPEGSFLHDRLERTGLIDSFRDVCPATVMEHIAQNYRYSRTAAHIPATELVRLTLPRLVSAMKRRVFRR